jgi:hypothetical protein
VDASFISYSSLGKDTLASNSMSSNSTSLPERLPPGEVERGIVDHLQ